MKTKIYKVELERHFVYAAAEDIQTVAKHYPPALKIELISKHAVIIKAATEH